MTNNKQALDRAVRHVQAGEVPQAEAVCAQIVERDPRCAEAWNLLGMLAYQTNKVPAALDYFSRACAAAPAAVSYRNNRGAVLQRLGARDGSRDGIPARAPPGPDARGGTLQSRQYPARSRTARGVGSLLSPGHRAQAVVRRRVQQPRQRPATAGPAGGGPGELRRAVALLPTLPEAHNNLGNVLRSLGRESEAAACFRQALALRPAYPEALNNLGTVLQDLGQPEEAEKCYRQTLALQPNLPDSYTNLGLVLQTLGRLEEAAACFQQALVLKPDSDDGYTSLGNVYAAMGRLDEAEASYRRASKFPQAYSNLGNLLDDQGRFTEAIASYRRRVEMKPDYADAHHNLALALLRSGDFASGLAEYEWRWQTKELKLPDYPQPLWDGSPLQGRTILLHPEQGLGDTLQFVRYAALVKAQAQRLAGGGTVICHGPRLLLPLLRTVPGIDQVVPVDTAPPAFDVHAPLLGLPRLFHTTAATIPAPIPYLSADPQLVDRWREQLAGVPGFKVGIVWQGNPKYHKDSRRSLPLSLFEPLARVPGVQLISLQVGPGQEQLAALAGSGGCFDVIDLGSGFDPSSFSDLAAVVKCLDLVVAVDTSVVHLSGALGVPVWPCCRSRRTVPAAGTRGQPVVSDGAPVPPAAAGSVERSVGPRDAGVVSSQ